MSRVLITGSSDGLGLIAGQLLIDQGHRVTLHARNEARAADTRRAAPQAEAILTGDASRITDMRSIAAQANGLGRFDAVIHNVAVGPQASRRIETAEGLSQLFAVNVLAPYLLTALITAPDRLVYLSSGMHRSGNPELEDLQWATRRWSGTQAYSDSKLFVVMLACAVARRWPKAQSNSLEPGWVPTKMGGAGAPDDLAQGAVTQAWLAVSDDPSARVSGQYFHHQKLQKMHPAASRVELQERLLDYCARLTGVTLP